MEDICYHDEDTLQKVHDALRGQMGKDDDEILNIVTVILNAGVFFRERLPYI